ncbi:16S rRNA (cytosine(1402)-N(4))-methyltransferase RsmH [Butyricicoccus pullicaecorum]|nr:16S rRNA (cytosine(1402)-N(4))-methyltransferase RsmH [Butyricicoccus pullicaecorum]
MNEFFHISILLAPCLDALRIRPDGVYIDATLGGAGHSRQIADRLTAGGTLLCIDRDDEALQNAETKLAPVRERVRLCKSDFRRLDEVLAREGFSGADGILFDLGVSSPQLDEGYRGFSYMQDAPLDMRMDRQQSLTAYDVVNGWSRDELRRILFEYGEERYAPLIAAAIEREREKKPIETTLELVSIIRSAMPAKALREKQHPAKRSFQAIRIAVNDELGAVAEAMDKAIDVLKPEGRLAVITFHSLEDRIVKTAFQKAAQGCTCPKDFPVCVCGKKPKVKIITRKPIVPDSREVAENARARSAKLRVCEKLGADGR